MQTLVLITVTILAVLFIRVKIVNYLSEKYMGKKIFNTDNYSETFLSMLDLFLITVLFMSLFRPIIYVADKKGKK